MSKKTSHRPNQPAPAKQEEELHYEPNPKHKDPWQPGRKGSLCPPLEELSLKTAYSLLKKSVAFGKKRYMPFEGRAFAAQSHAEGRWHGYPVGWREVPAVLRTQWLAEKAIQKHDLKRFW